MSEEGNQWPKKLIEFLDAEKFNKLVHLFDEKMDDNKDGEKHIIKYIQKERKRRGLSDDGVTMYSMVYGEHQQNSTLHLNIVKDKVDYLHITIHLSPRGLEPMNQGLIHFVKDIYIRQLKLKKAKKRPVYTLIHVEEPPHKPQSLHFFRTDGDNTHVDKSHGDYDSDLAVEMDVIVEVMNRLFDENDHEYYIGHMDDLYPIHNKTNIVLQNVNQSNVIPKRKNMGSLLLPSFHYADNRMIVPRRRKTEKVRRNIENRSTNKELSRKTMSKRMQIKRGK